MISSKTTSTILYKFRSSTNFESVEIPGSSARLFDIKRAIVKAKKLDGGVGSSAPQLEFDLSIKNSLTEEEYKDESMLIPRGTRLVIQRLPAAKGYGLLARIARAEAGMSSANNLNTNSSAFKAPTGYFTIQSRAGEEDEFVDAQKNSMDYSSQMVPQATAGPSGDPDSEERELAALKAVTDQAASIFKSQTTLSRNIAPNKLGPAATMVAGAPRPMMNTIPTYGAPNRVPVAKYSTTDPELKEYEMKQGQTKKRATGIPRTFLTMGGADGNTIENGTDGEKDLATIRLQPNNVGFEALIQRGGGQSESGGNQTRSLEYALKLTATATPDHLKCGICQGVVKNAMLVPWDTEGRAVCELCMRDSLAKNGFKCPLTGMDGVSPEDLHPNYGLRKAADLFVQGVMSLMDEIILKQQADEEEEQKRDKELLLLASKDSHKKVDDIDMDDNGLASQTNRSMIQTKRKRHDLLDLDADFGGDVFAVSKDEDHSIDDELMISARSDPSPGHIQADKGTIDNYNNINGDDLFHDTVEINLDSDKNKVLANDSGDIILQKSEPMDSASCGNQTVPSMESNLIANNRSSFDTEFDPTTNINDGPSPNCDGDDVDPLNPKNGSDTTKHSANDSKKSTATTIPVIDRRELNRSRGPPPGYRIGPAGAIGVHGVFPPSSPPVAMNPARPFQPSPTQRNVFNPSRVEGHPMNASESYRGRGQRGRNFNISSGGRDFRDAFPSYHTNLKPQLYNDYTPVSMGIEINQGTSMDSAGHSGLDSLDERAMYNPEDMQDLPVRESPNREFYGESVYGAREGRGMTPLPRGGPFIPRGRGRSFDPRVGRGRGRDMPHEHWQDFGGRNYEPDIGRGHDMMGRGFDPRGGRGYEPRGGRFPDHFGGRGFGRGMNPGVHPGRGRF